MPHVSEVRATSHDRHDALLVAALAAGDLAATDRDQAIALTRSCTECATLHDDLVAIARATATVPPPIGAANRDFRLTPEDAARLRGGGWRRILDVLRAPGQAVYRPLGVGLTTLGLVGLLIGNVQLNNGAASSPMAAGGSTQETVRAAASSATGLTVASNAPDAVGPAQGASAPAASAAAAGSSAPGPSTVDVASEPSPSSAGPGGVAALPPEAAASDGKALASADDRQAADQAVGRDAGVADPGRPLNLLFKGAVAVGLGLQLASRIRGRPVR
jgi:hypothetical protein